MLRLLSLQGDTTFRLLSMALALGMFLLVAPANADDPIDAAENAAQDIQDQVDQQEDQIDQQLEDQQDQIDQQLDQTDEQIEQQTDELDQQIDQRTDQLDEQSDQLNNQLDEAEDQAERQVNEFEDQLDQAQDQTEPQADQPLRLGVSIDENVEATSEGLTIREVTDGSLAADAGLRRGDVIMSIDGQSFTTVDDLNRFMQQRTAGDTAEIIVLRNGQQHPMNITFRHAHFQDQDRYGAQTYGQQQYANHGWLGITLRDDGRQDPFGPQQVEGAVVETVYPGGPAADAGIQAGDRIVQVNDRQVSSVNHLLETLQQTNPGDRVELVVFAGGNERSVTATLADSSVFNVVSRESSYGPQGQFGSTEFETFPTQSASYDELIEMHRRMEEQHQRVESMLNQMQQDIAEIRRQLDRNVQDRAPTSGRDFGQPTTDAVDPDYQPEQLPRGSLPPTDEVPERSNDNPPNPN